MSVLEKILAHKQTEIDLLDPNLLDIEAPKASLDFKAAITKSKNTPHLIAEIKKASPSRGWILSEKTDVVPLAQTYQDHQAHAISVLTDNHFFAGHLNDLKAVSEAVTIPTLRKDFISDERQIIQARLNGASAVLLMTSVVKTASRLQILRQYAESLDMHALVETQDEEEIEIAVNSGAQIIGVNARHFSDLSVDINRVPPLLQKIPQGIVRVAESGIYTKADVTLVGQHCDAILVGTGLLCDGLDNIERNIKELVG